MEGNGVTEKGVVIGLVASDIREFQREIVDCIDNFYNHYDCRKSLDREYILELIAKVHGSLKSILELLV